MKVFAALVVCIMLVVTVSHSQETRLEIGKYAVPGDIAGISKELISGPDVIPEARSHAPGEGIEYLSSCLWTDLSAARVENGKIYCAFNYGLAILDATIGPPFETISTLYIPSTRGRDDVLEKHGDYVYFTRDTELLVIDVADAVHPTVVGAYPSQGEFASVLFDDGALYLREPKYGLTILDLSEPAVPRLLVTTNAYGDWPEYVSASGGIAVTGDRNGFKIIDVSDRTAPALLSSRELSNIANVVVRDDLLFAFKLVYGEPDSIVVYDLTDPADPSVAGVHVTSDPEVLSGAMMLSGPVLFTAGEIIDISDASNPVAIADYSGYAGIPFGLDGNTLYKRSGTYCQTFDIADMENPYDTGVHVFPGLISDVYVQNDIAYVGAIFQGLTILDISDIHHPVVLSELNSAVGFKAFDVQGDILFSGRYVVDVSDPANPVILANVGGTEFFDVHYGGDLAFGVSRDVDRPNGLRSFDLSDPRDPKILSLYSVYPRSFISMAVKDTLAFIAPAQGSPAIHILNYADPTAPDVIGTYGTASMPAWNVTVAVEGNIMYTRIDHDLHVVDIHDPRNPVTIGIFDEFNLWYPIMMLPKGDILYTTDRFGNTVVFDVSDPGNPLYLENFETPSGSTQNLFIDGQRIYLADYYALMIARTPYGVPPARQVALDINPGSCQNPLNVSTPKGANANGGVLPVAILGSDEFNVRDIDISSLELAGASPLRHGFEDIATPASVDDDCACAEMGRDGYADLALKFRRLDVVAGLGSVAGGDVPIALTGQMKDGTPIEGTDCVRIVPRKDDAGPQPVSTDVPAATALGSATPNPFNPTTVIGYELAAREHVTLCVYDVTGKLVATLVDEEIPRGRHHVTWEAKGFASGVYFYRLQAGSFGQTRKMVLLK